jgi:hypothetical protein
VTPRDLLNTTVTRSRNLNKLPDAVQAQTKTQLAFCSKNAGEAWATKGSEDSVGSEL